MTHARVSKALTTLQAVISIALIAVVAVSGYWWYTSSQARKAKLEVFTQFEVELEDLRQTLKIPAFSAAIVKNQELIWAKGFGYADLENKVEATPETPYHLASVTKPFAATIIMQLVEEGKLDLDDPVSRYGIDIDSPGIVKVRHLLTHTSEGIPGSSYNYRGDRYALLSSVITQASGRPFLELLINRILEPLDMTNTAPSIIEASELDRDFTYIHEELAKPYRLDSTYEVIEGEYPQHFSASAGLISTVVDMAIFDIAIDQNALVGQETKEQMFTPTVSTTGAELPYGFGWFTQSYKGTRLIWHYGYWDCISSLILKVPDEDITFIILANTDMLSRPYRLGDGDVLTSTVALVFLKTFVLQPKYDEPIPVIDWKADIDDLTDQLKQITDKELQAIIDLELLSYRKLYNGVGNWELSNKLLKARGEWISARSSG